MQNETVLAETVAFLTRDGMRIPFIEKDTRLPIDKTELFTTARDNQETIRVHLVQGETSIVELEFPILARVPRGVPKISLTVGVSSAGELSLTFKEPETTNILDRGGLAVLIR